MRIIKRIFILISICTLVCGCSSKGVEKTTNRLSKVILNSLYEESPSTKKLTRKEREIYSAFRESQMYENYVVNLSELGLIFEESFATVEPTKEIYKENGDYLIKYTDLNFNNENQSAILAVDNYGINLFKRKVPIMYDETAGSENYLFMIDFHRIFDDKIEYYCKNLVDDTGLIIRFKLDKNNITNIYMIYEDYYVHEDIKEAENKKGPFRVFFVAVIVSLLVIAFIFVYKKLGDMSLPL